MCLFININPRYIKNGSNKILTRFPVKNGISDGEIESIQYVNEVNVEEKIIQTAQTSICLDGASFIRIIEIAR